MGDRGGRKLNYLVNLIFCVFGFIAYTVYGIASFVDVVCCCMRVLSQFINGNGRAIDLILRVPGIGINIYTEL